jgi:putative ABC transport system permease protein
MTSRPAHATPPRLAEALVAACLPGGLVRDSLLGDLQEEFTWRARLTNFAWATFWYWRQAGAIGLRYLWERTTHRVRSVRPTRALGSPGSSVPVHPSRNRTMIDSLIHDVRYVLRTLRREPGWTAGAVGTLALAIGATTAIFSVVNAVLFRPLDYTEPDRLVVLRYHPADDATRAVWGAWSERSQIYARSNTTWPQFESWEVTTHDIFRDLAAYNDAWSRDVNLGEGTERLPGALVSAGFFRALQVPPVLGRWLLDEEDRPGSPGAVILSYGLWQRRFGGSDQVIGRIVTIQEQPHTVVGVMPAGFDPFSATVEYWLPMANASRGPGSVNYEVLARLQDGISVEHARAQLAARTIETERRNATQVIGASFVTLRRHIVGDVRLLLLIFMGAVSALLLIACVNVVNLMLTRATAREHEHVVRAALGAGSGRLIQQLLTESTVLGLLGAALGLPLAFGLTDTMLALAPDSIPRLAEIGIDGGVLAFSVGLAIVVGVAVGLLPAARAARLDLATGLNEGAQRSAGGLRQGRIRDVLVVTQVGLALVLLVCGGLLFKSFLGLLHVETGFNAANVVTFETSLPYSRYPAFEDRRRYYDALLNEVRALPGVQTAGVSIYLLGTNAFRSNDFQVEGYQPGPSEQLLTETKEVSPGYFSSLNIPLLQGRMFDDRDDLGAPGTVLVSQSMAQRYWPEGRVVGGKIKLDDDEEWSTVVGVVSDVRYRGEVRDAPQVYKSYGASGRGSNMDVVVRVASEPVELIPSIRRLLASIDPDVSVFRLGTLEGQLSAYLTEPRFRTLLLGAFGLTSLILSIVGVYGVMAYAVAQRTRELGIRKALGADGGRIVRGVILRGVAITAVGLALGAAGAYAAADVLQGYLVNVDARDPVTFAVGVVGLAAAALLACYLPARRAARVDPLIALRAE